MLHKQPVFDKINHSLAQKICFKKVLAIEVLHWIRSISCILYFVNIDKNRVGIKLKGIHCVHKRTVSSMTSADIDLGVLLSYYTTRIIYFQYGYA